MSATLILVLATVGATLCYLPLVKPTPEAVTPTPDPDADAPGRTIYILGMGECIVMLSGHYQIPPWFFPKNTYMLTKCPKHLDCPMGSLIYYSWGPKCKPFPWHKLRGMLPKLKLLD